jgi:hypothetical protein
MRSLVYACTMLLLDILNTPQATDFTALATTATSKASDWLAKLQRPRPQVQLQGPPSHLHSFSMEFDTASQSLSPGAAIGNPALRLPATCEPPSENNPPKRAVWIVCNLSAV